MWALRKVLRYKLKNHLCYHNSNLEEQEITIITLRMFKNTTVKHNLQMNLLQKSFLSIKCCLHNSASIQQKDLHKWQGFKADLHLLMREYTYINHLHLRRLIGIQFMTTKKLAIT